MMKHNKGVCRVCLSAGDRRSMYLTGEKTFKDDDITSVVLHHSLTHNHSFKTKTQGWCNAPSINELQEIGY